MTTFPICADIILTLHFCLRLRVMGKMKIAVFFLVTNCPDMAARVERESLFRFKVISDLR